MLRRVRTVQDPSEDRDFLVCALDTLSGVLEALGPKAELLLGRSGLRDIVLHCCQARRLSAQVKHSTYISQLHRSSAAAPTLEHCLARLLSFSWVEGSILHPLLLGNLTFFGIDSVPPCSSSWQQYAPGH